MKFIRKQSLAWGVLVFLVTAPSLAVVGPATLPRTAAVDCRECAPLQAQLQSYKGSQPSSARAKMMTASMRELAKIVELPGIDLQKRVEITVQTVLTCKEDLVFPSDVPQTVVDFYQKNQSTFQRFFTQKSKVAGSSGRQHIEREQKDFVDVMVYSQETETAQGDT